MPSRPKTGIPFHIAGGAVVMNGNVVLITSDDGPGNRTRLKRQVLAARGAVIGVQQVTVEPRLEEHEIAQERGEPGPELRAEFARAMDHERERPSQRKA